MQPPKRPPGGEIVFRLKTLDHLMKKNAEAHMRLIDPDRQLTRMHHWIIGYLYAHQADDIFQRDIETEFKISRSTTSSMLSLMEKKGFISRTSVESDARLKKLTLTEMAVNLHESCMDDMRRMDLYIESSITLGEKAELIRILDKLGKAVSDVTTEDNA